MLIATLSTQISLPRFFSTPYPFIWGRKLVFNSNGTYWTDIFGAPIESNLSPVTVTEVRVNGDNYIEVTNLADCIATVGSWFFDSGTQFVYSHLEHDLDGLTSSIVIGKTVGFSDSDVLDIGGTEYLPLILTSPRIGQTEDLIASDRLSMINGEITFDNRFGLFESAIDVVALIGGEARLYYLDADSVDARGVADESDLVIQASFFVEDYQNGYDQVSVKVQDKRVTQNADFPTLRLEVDDYPDINDDLAGGLVPTVYGYQRELKAIPVDGLAASTTVRYRAALLLTALTAVYLKINDVWTVATPSSIDLPSGEFSVAGAKSSTTASPYECRIEAVGIAVTYASDVIKDLNLRYAGIDFLTSFYDLTEWAEEEVGLSTIGVVFSETTTIFDAVAVIQNGANVRFRYEINARGQRTIRIDDPDRESVAAIDNVQIMAPELLLPETDTQFLAASVRIGYAKSDQSGKSLTVVNTDFQASALALFRTRKEVRFDSLLTTEEDAIARASYDAIRLSSPLTSVQTLLRGSEFLGLRMFDILRVAVTDSPIDLESTELEDPDDRLFYGVQMCKVVGIDPDFKLLGNIVTLQLLGAADPIVPPMTVLVYSDGTTRMSSFSGAIIRAWEA